MNNNHRDNFEELDAERTAQVLESGHFDTAEENRTAELGRLLRQSAEHDLPPSNDSLREQLLAELPGEEVPVAPTKTLAVKDEYRVSRRRMWMALPAGVLLMAGGWFMYSGWAVQMAQTNWKAEVQDLGTRAEAAERSVSLGFETDSPTRTMPHPMTPGVKLPSGNDLKERLEFAEKMQRISAGPPGADRFVGSGKQQGAQQDGQNAKLYSLAHPFQNKKQQDARLNYESASADYVAPMEQPPQSKPVFSARGMGGGGFGGGGGGMGSTRAKGMSLDMGNADSGRRNLTMSVYDDGTSLRGVRRYRADGEDRESKELSRGYFEKVSGEQYAPIHENLFVQATGGSAISTFSIDVDTASYANMRRFLNSGQRPPRDSVRIEELVNYFQYDYPQPKGEDPFSVNMELATCPWNGAHKLLRVGLKGKEIHVKERPATNVVYLIDVSGSMNSADKLPLLKSGFQMMTKQLGENDRVSIVTYAGNAGVALEPTTGEKTKTIHDAIERLTSGGSTHGSAGIELAYKLAQQHFIKGGVNKVILATDGDLNVGVTDDGSLVKLIKQKASEGVFLTVLGFGTGNLKDAKLEKIADNGNGHYAYIDSNREAHRVLVQQMSGSLVTIAKDVKIQIEFNPAEVSKYRLIGYENRILATKDFDNDRKDAGEIGAGHTVTAIYEIEPTGGVAGAFTAPEGMKYQSTEQPANKVVEPQQGLTEAASSGELATVALRYKKPDENESKRIEFTIKNEEQSFGSASEDFRFAASVAGFGMLLRGSEHAGDATSQKILQMASESIGDDPSGYRAEFVDLVRKACYGQ